MAQAQADPIFIISTPISPWANSRNAITVGLSLFVSTIGGLPIEICLALIVAAKVISNRLGIFFKQSSTVIRATLFLLE
jgi:hypothetical protein